MEQKRINFDSEYVEEIMSGKKVTTVRKGIKRYPVGRIVDLTAESRPFARARVDKVVVKRVRELTDSDARLDGFESREELIEALNRIYGKVKDEEFVTVVHFTVVE
ncbi:ASCH domain-containing protein [Geoglobus acetivorans]|uniref:ASCH domain-containing protein n=1 Tax=Geoglobus acetivorans TaxID=565033 RepID=A0ABZ3H1Z7_GEOAI|nr:ASCH domain-containing protein [Geoglobus acetivorans]